MADILLPEVRTRSRNMTIVPERYARWRVMNASYSSLDDPFVDEFNLDCQQNVMRRAVISYLACMRETERLLDPSKTLRLRAHLGLTTQEPLKKEIRFGEMLAMLEL